MKLPNFIRSNYLTILVITGVLIFAAITHGFNMFHFPYYENDEGAYLSQAWSLLKFGQLAPYTYWYDHAPAGWIFIAIWTFLTGGFFTFGTSINSGRVFMLVIHVLSTLLVLLISKRLTGRYWAGIIASVIFSLSPLGIYFQRRVLLDNLMIFWVLVSLWALLKEKFTLRNVYLSAIAFGIAVLTKENAIFFLPAFLYVLHQKSHNFHKRFAYLNWLTVSALLISLYFLYAILKSEFLPLGLFSTSTDRVSLLATLQQQSSRGISLPFWNPQSEFYGNLLNWINKDRYVIYIGIASTLISTILSFKVKAFRIPTFFLLCFWLFLMRGKLVIEFYIIPLIPLFALSTGMIIDFISQHIFSHKKYGAPLINSLVIIGLVYLFLQNPLNHFRNNETLAHTQAISWIKDNLPQDTKIVIDGSMYVDLHEARFPGDKIFPMADWYWKVDYDPEVKINTLHNRWNDIEYIGLSHEMLKQISLGTQKFPKKALDNSEIVVDYWSNNQRSYRNVSTYSSTNGDWMSIYKVASSDEIMLTSSWNYFKNKNIHSYGQVINPLNGQTTSTDQANAMLRAVWLNDKNTFDGLWSWTKDHMQHRGSDSLLSSEWDNNTLSESESDSEADQDIALSLIMAYKVWGKDIYKQEANKIITDIWKKEISLRSGKYTINGGTGDPLSKPSALSPAAYKLFAQIDTMHPWEIVANDSYKQIETIKSPTKTDSCFDATGKMSLDAILFNDQRTSLILDEMKNSSSSAITNLEQFSFTDRKKADQLFSEKFEKKFNFDEGYWNPRTDYSMQDCAWAGTVIYKHMTPPFIK